MARRKRWVIHQYHKTVADARKELTKSCNNYRNHDLFGYTVESVKLMSKDPHGGPNVYVKHPRTKGKGRRYYKIVLRLKKGRKRRRKK